MKTSKLFVIASIVAIAIVGISISPDLQAKNKAVVHITLEQAIQNIDLVREMHVQLNTDFLQTNQLYYTQHVVHNNNVIVCITGSYDGWTSFFRTRAFIQATDLS